MDEHQEQEPQRQIAATAYVGVDVGPSNTKMHGKVVRRDVTTLCPSASFLLHTNSRSMATAVRCTKPTEDAPLCLEMLQPGASIEGRNVVTMFMPLLGVASIAEVRPPVLAHFQGVGMELFDALPDDGLGDDSLRIRLPDGTLVSSRAVTVAFVEGMCALIPRLLAERWVNVVPPAVLDVKITASLPDVPRETTLLYEDMWNRAWQAGEPAAVSPVLVTNEDRASIVACLPHVGVDAATPYRNVVTVDLGHASCTVNHRTLVYDAATGESIHVPGATHLSDLGSVVVSDAVADLVRRRVLDRPGLPDDYFEDADCFINKLTVPYVKDQLKHALSNALLSGAGEIDFADYNVWVYRGFTDDLTNTDSWDKMVYDAPINTVFRRDEIQRCFDDANRPLAAFLRGSGVGTPDTCTICIGGGLRGAMVSPEVRAVLGNPDPAVFGFERSTTLVAAGNVGYRVGHAGGV